MSRGFCTVLFLGALVAGVVPALADDNAPGAGSAPPVPALASAADSLVPPVPLPDTPLARELRQARAEFTAELRRLTDAWRAATTPAAAREIEGRIAAFKANDERCTLEIRARHARAAGLTARADELDQLLADLRAAQPAAATPAAGN